MTLAADATRPAAPNTGRCYPDQRGQPLGAPENTHHGRATMAPNITGRAASSVTLTTVHTINGHNTITTIAAHVHGQQLRTMGRNNTIRKVSPVSVQWIEKNVDPTMDRMMMPSKQSDDSWPASGGIKQQ